MLALLQLVALQVNSLLLLRQLLLVLNRVALTLVTLEILLLMLLPVT
jgi:hypothetical protein